MATVTRTSRCHDRRRGETRWLQMSVNQPTRSPQSSKDRPRPQVKGCLVWASVAPVVVAILGAWVPAGLAWACVPQARLVSLQPNSSGPSGTQVTVNGLGLDRTAIEIRWNSSDGPLLGKATGPDFSTPITVPDAPKGLYNVIALSRDTVGGIGSAASTPFQVTAPDRSGEGSEASASETSSGKPEPRRRKSDGSPGLAVLGGGLLLVLGAVIGALSSRRLTNR